MKKIMASFLIFCVTFSPFVLGQAVSDVRSLLSSEGKILYGNEPNSVVVMDHPDNIKKIEDYLSIMDTAPQQVLIEARVVEIKLSKENSLGINWTTFAEHEGLRMGQFNIGSTVNSAGSAIEQNIPYKPVFYPPGGASEELPFTLNIFDENINTVLRTLATSYDTNILSAPRLTTVNNRSAEIKIVRAIPWAEPSVTISESGLPVVSWTVHFENVGIVLSATPTITNDGQISMELKPDISEKTGDFPLTIVQDGVQYPYSVPIVDKRTANTKAIVGNGQTFIIGGLIKESTIKGTSKVPLLGDVPLLGWAFKSQKETKEKIELLIFVSPTIITPAVVSRMGKMDKSTSGESRLYADASSGDMELLKIDKDKWRKIMSSVNSLENKVDNLVDKRSRLEKDIKKEKDYRL